MLGENYNMEENKALKTVNYMIKVSIIVSIYNCENYLKRCLDSLVNQTLKEIEIILVDDCLTDNIRNILEKYIEKYYDKIKVINLIEKRGVGGARNVGLECAKWRYIGFVDGDDDVSLEMFERLYKIAYRFDYDIVDCKFFNEYTNENMITTCKDALGILNLEKRKLVVSNPGYVWSKIIKKVF